MKLEKIDDNSIRCTLSSLDLSSRNLNLRDMTYGSQAAKQLFNEMMQKARVELGFILDNTPLMIEAIPLQGGSVQLIISKVEDPEELDTRFSKFTQRGDGQGSIFSRLASQILEGAQGLLKQAQETEDAAAGGGKSASEEEESGMRIFRFDSLDRVMDAAAAAGDSFRGGSTLYKEEDRRRYYLTLHPESGKGEDISRLSNLLSEYGEKVEGDELNEAYYEEHFETLMGEDAMRKLALI